MGFTPQILIPQAFSCADQPYSTRLQALFRNIYPLYPGNVNNRIYKPLIDILVAELNSLHKWYYTSPSTVFPQLNVYSSSFDSESSPTQSD